MNCETFRGQTHEIADGLLAPADAEAARAHAATCPECAARLDVSRRFSEFLAGNGVAAIEAWAADAALAAAVADDKALRAAVARRPSLLRRLLPFAAAAAAAAVLAVVVTLSFGRGSHVLDEGRPIALARGERALAGEGREVEAEDNAQLVVAPGSAGAALRLDAGTMLFRVEPGRPFAVETPQGIASVLGTSFHIAVTPDRQVSVTVHSGHVKFAGPRETTTLGPGDRLEVDAHGAQRLVNRRRLDELEAAAARRVAPRAAPEPAENPSQPPVAIPPSPAAIDEAVRAYFASDEGRKLVAGSLQATHADLAEAFAGMAIDGWLARLTKEADLTDDQTKRMREIFVRAAKEFGAVWTSTRDASPADRERVREEGLAKSAQIKVRIDDEVKVVLSSTQYEVYQSKFRAELPSFDGGTHTRNR